MERAPCKWCLPYTGEDDHLLPVSVIGEKVANISGVEGIELAERTIIVQSKVRKVFSGLFNGFSKQKSSKKPSEITVADVKTAIKKLKNLVKEKFEGETRMLELLEYISNKGEKNVPQCYIDLIYEFAKNVLTKHGLILEKVFRQCAQPFV